MRPNISLVAIATFLFLVMAIPVDENVKGETFLRGNAFYRKNVRLQGKARFLQKRNTTPELTLEQKALKDDLFDLVDFLRNWMLQGFDYKQFDESIGRYESELLEIETLAEEIGTDSFNLDLKLTVARRLLDAMKNVTEKIFQIKECDYPGTDLMEDMLVLKVDVLSMFDDDGKPDISLYGFDKSIVLLGERLEELRAKNTERGVVDVMSKMFADECALVSEDLNRLLHPNGLETSRSCHQY